MKKSQLGDYLILAIAAFGTFLVIVVPTLLCLGSAVLLLSCKGTPTQPEDIALTRPMEYLDDPCPVEGPIVKIETIPGSNGPLESASPLVMLLVDANEDSPMAYNGALAQKQDNFKIGDRVEICYTYVLLVHSQSPSFSYIGFARKLPDSSYEPSDLEKYEQFQDELKECNEHTSTLIKAMQTSKEDE